MNTNGTKSGQLLSLLLHDVTDEPHRSGFMQPTAFRYKHSVSAFGEYLDAVEESGLPVTVLQDHGLDLRTASCRISFTFDDGGASACTAADLLEQRNWRGLFFVTTGLIGKRGFLTSRQICDLASRGHVIGSHSCTHPDVFRSLSRQHMRQEWTDSRNLLQDLLGQPVNVGSVPGGDCDNVTIEEAATAGLTTLFTSEQVTTSWDYAGATCYGRMMMLNSTAPETLRRWLRHPTVGVLPERAVRFAKSSVKSLMGPFYMRLVERRRAQHEHA